tara:strand:+ start:1946 stop:2230 length:285 start_codon:yes stop_codon:yes gene_type:complete
LKVGCVLGESKATLYVGSTGEIMGVIFRDEYDDQQESLMKSIAIGNTWQYRIFKIKALMYGVLASAVTGVTALGLDYAVYKLTDSPNLLAWILG